MPKKELTPPDMLIKENGTFATAECLQRLRTDVSLPMLQTLTESGFIATVLVEQVADQKPLKYYSVRDTADAFNSNLPSHLRNLLFEQV